jgi:hypothetical protein
MKFSLRTSTLALAVMLGSASLFSITAEAKSSFMTECSAKFKAAKADGSIDATMKWTDFMKTTCKADTAATQAVAIDPAPMAPKAKKVKTTAAPAVTPSGSFMEQCSAAWKDLKAKNAVPAGLTWKAFVAGKCVATPAAATTAAATAPAAKTTMSQSFIKQCGDDWTAMKKAGTVPAGLTWKDFVIGKCKATPAMATTAPDAPTGQTFMQKCSADWKAMKTAGTVPAGLVWKDFIAAKCVVDGMAAPATPVVAAKPAMKKPAAKAQIDAPAEPTTTDPNVKLVDKNGKPFTPGQLAAHERARTCGAKWRAEKEAGTLDAGMKWPQYWSACNKMIKAATAQ